MASRLLPVPKSTPPEVRSVVFTEDQIAACVDRVAAEINRDFGEQPLVVAGILRGAAPFTCDLVRRLTPPVLLDFISLRGYRSSSRTEGVEILKDLEIPVRDRHVLLVEDIVDTGLTLHHLVEILRQRSPASLSICTLLNRPDLRLVELPVRYSGFTVKEEFLIGYGLDYRNQFRDLPYIASMEVDLELFSPNRASLRLVTGR